jgi:hypothetical protein
MSMDEQYLWMNFFMNIGQKKLGEKLNKKTWWEKFMFIYFEKFNTWNVEVIFEILLYSHLVWIFASFQPYKL